ncbi:MAG: FAD-dependent monooxygenase, partial [Pseudomonadota bacterium]
MIVDPVDSADPSAPRQHSGQNAPQRCDVAIVGAGLAGKLAALALRHVLPDHTALALIDRGPILTSATNTARTTDQRATALSAASVNLLTNIGLWDGATATEASRPTHTEVADAGLIARAGASSCASVSTIRRMGAARALRPASATSVSAPLLASVAVAPSHRPML